MLNTQVCSRPNSDPREICVSAAPGTQQTFPAEHAEQLSIGPPFADVKRQPAFDGHEAARLHDVDDEVGLHFGRPVAQLA